MRWSIRWLREALRFLGSNPAALALVGGAAASGGLLGVLPGTAIYDYMWRDPRFCGDCHVHDYANENWDRSVHAQLTTCHDCHRVPIRHYPRNLYKTVFVRPQTPEDVPAAHVEPVLCEQCHATDGGHEPLTGPMPAELRAYVAKVDGSPLHAAHLESKWEDAAIVCLDCHGGRDLEVHTFRATSLDCAPCHASYAPTDEHGADLSCLDCHGTGFLGSRPTEPLSGELK